jgi:hypothetical protein
MPESQRKSERVLYTKPVRILKPAPMDGKALDIAAGGMGVEVAQAIAEGTAVELELFGSAVVQGTVRKVLPGSAGGVRLGIQFAKEDPGLVAKAQA